MGLWKEIMKEAATLRELSELAVGSGGARNLFQWGHYPTINRSWLGG